MDAAEPEGPPISFSKIVLELDSMEIAESDATIRKHVLDHLREGGLHVVGMESSLFEIDRTGDARFLLGATITAWDARTTLRFHEFEMTLEWQVLDTVSAEVVYTNVTRGYVAGPKMGDRIPAALRTLGVVTAAGTTPARIAQASQDTVPIEQFFGALDDGLDRLVARPGFQAVLAAAAPEGVTEAPPPLAIRRCETTRTLPDELDSALDVAVSILGAGGAPVGTGVVVSPDGWVVTAAHVVNSVSAPKVRVRGAAEPVPATVVRQDPDADVALLWIEGEGRACAPLAALTPAVGAELWAIGSPLGSRELELSVTRGVVSGFRTIASTPRIQTDASVSPGYSGGPMMTADGAAAAITASKLVGFGVEGLSFGVPAPAAVERLGLTWSDVSDPLPTPAAQDEAPPPADPDDGERMGSLDDEVREQLRKGARNTWITGLVLGSAGVAISGVAGGVWVTDGDKTVAQIGTLRAVDATGITLASTGLVTVLVGVANANAP